MGETEQRAKRILLAALVWLVLVGLAFGAWMGWTCLTRERITSQTGSESRYRHEPTLYLDPFSGYAILRSTKMADLLAKEGIRLRIVDDKADYVGRMEALKKAKADLAVFTIDSMLTAGAKIGEFPSTIVMVIDETKGADAIVAYKTVRNLQDLNQAGARFVLTPDSPSEFLARVVVADFHLPDLPAKWITPAGGAADVYARFQKAARSDPAAFVLWEPYVSKALRDPEAHVLIGSDKIKGYIVDVLVARRKFLIDQPMLVEAVVKAYLRAAYSHGQSGMVDLVMEDAKAAGERLTQEEAAQIVRGIQWKNTLENYAHFRLISAQESRGLEDLEDIITKISRVLEGTGAISGGQIKMAPNDLFHNGILARLQSTSFHPGQKIGVVEGTGSEPEAIRGELELPALSEAEWNAMVPVGQMRVKQLSFLRGTSELNLESRRDLEDLAATLKSMPMYYLLVIGHARAQGDPNANLRLAQERADMTAAYLTLRLGISPNRVRATAAPPSDEGGAAQAVTFQVGQRPY